MMKKYLFLFPLMVGASSVLLFLLYYRPYYLARYGFFATILTIAGGIITIIFCVQGSANHLPATIIKWIASYAALILIITSIFITVYAYPYFGHPETYDNPFILRYSENEMEYDRGTIEASIQSMIGRRTPPLTFYSLDDAQQRGLDDYRGNVILLNI